MSKDKLFTLIPLEQLERNFRGNTSGVLMSFSWRKELYKEAAEKLGVKLCWDEQLKPGDMYIAARNTGPHLLTCAHVDEKHNFVVPVEDAYYFNISECCKVKDMEEIQ